MNGKLISSTLAREILSAFNARAEKIEEFIKTLVEIESPSGDEVGSREIVDALASAAQELDCVNAIERREVPGFGQHLVIEAFKENSKAGQILLIGHTDTVHGRGSLAARPWRRDANRIYGPGIFDMKSN